MYYAVWGQGCMCIGMTWGCGAWYQGCTCMGVARGLWQGLTHTRAAWGHICEAGDVCIQGDVMVLWGWECVYGGCGAAVCEGRGALEWFLGETEL